MKIQKQNIPYLGYDYVPAASHDFLFAVPLDIVNSAMIQIRIHRNNITLYLKIVPRSLLHQCRSITPNCRVDYTERS